MSKIGDREVKVCKETGLPVIMEFTGDLSDDISGYSGWRCLHNYCPEDDAKDIADFLVGRKPSTPLWAE